MTHNLNSYQAIGMMSGTSLDGLDIALVKFHKDADVWSHKIVIAETIPYTHEWQSRLQFNLDISAIELMHLDHDYGNFLAESCHSFIQRHGIVKSEVDLISSHGHTLYHQPQKGFTLQIGNGPQIYAATGITTVCNFRPQDISLGGQGAPLVPIGDELLFAEYDACLNLGGFANISIKKEGNRLAFDICAVNTILNHLAKRLNYSFDEDGRIARKGRVDPELLTRLNGMKFYQDHPPKSLGVEWLHSNVLPCLDQFGGNPSTLMATYTEHIADQVAAVINKYIPTKGQVLLSGGGSLNKYLIELLRTKCTSNILVPEPTLINYREALTFAFLGVLRIRNEVNVIASATGASKDHSCGIIYGSVHHQ